MALGGFSKGLLGGSALTGDEVWEILFWPFPVGFIPLLALAYWAWVQRVGAIIAIGFALLSLLPLLWLIS